MKKPILGGLVAVFFLSLSSVSGALTVTHELRLGIGISGNEGDTYIRIRSPNSDGYSKVWVGAEIKEEGTVQDRDDDQCDRSGTSTIDCLALAVDLSLTDTCRYCGTGWGEPDANLPSAWWQLPHSRRTCRVFRNGNNN